MQRRVAARRARAGRRRAARRPRLLLRADRARRRARTTRALLGEEIFGPVAPVATFTTEEQALEAANRTEYGLVAYVYTRDLARALPGLRAASRRGMVGLNQGVVSNPAAPFGGVKQSGFGREGGFEGIGEYLETKYVAVGGVAARVAALRRLRVAALARHAAFPWHRVTRAMAKRLRSLRRATGCARCRPPGARPHRGTRHISRGGISEMTSIKKAGAVLCVGLLAVALAACGSSSKTTSSSSSALSSAGFQSPLTQSQACVKRGGVLNVLDESDYEHLDAGISYLTLDYTVVFATQRPLYSFKPNTATEPSPDMASGPPEVSNGNKTVTVHLTEGIHFSPPVNREVTSEDVAYALERGANPNVANPYFESYFASIEGAPTANGGPIKGIETPTKHEIVFHLSEPKAAVVTKALVLPLSSAVPKEYAEKYDKNKPSNYAAYEVATGPYMIKNNKEGKVLDVGYVPGKSLTLVRNPNWNASTDFRPACLNEIAVKIGGTASVIDREVLAGTNVVSEREAATSAVKEAAESHKSQLELDPNAGARWIGLDNKVAPFKNVDLRKAVWAALPRVSMIRARGGSDVGVVATHFIPPALPGFAEAGGLPGPKLDYDEHPEGDMAVAEKYMKLAGYPSGKYSGPSITVVGAKGSPEEQDAEIVNATLKSLGFTTKFVLVELATMFAKYCNVPKEEINVCPDVAWIPDFADPQAELDITFSGHHIEETSNVNWGQTNVAKINKAMEEAEVPVEEAVRAKDWAKIDDELVEDANDRALGLGTGAVPGGHRSARRRTALEHRFLGPRLHLVEVGARRNSGGAVPQARPLARRAGSV